MSEESHRGKAAPGPGSPPRISCVIPVFNGKAELPRAVKSVLAQGPDTEAILVDDGSTDGTAALVVELARSDARIVPILLPENRGQGNARNIGVAAATAPYVTFLDHDDEHIAGWYDYAIAALDANAGCAAIKGGVEYAGLTAELNVAPGDPRLALMAESVVWNVVCRKVAVQAMGGYPALRQCAEDVAFMWVLKRHFAIARTDYPSTVHYVRRDNGAGQYLRRTRVDASGAVVAEAVTEEQDGSLKAQLEAFLQQSDSRVRSLRATLKSWESGQ